MGVERSAVGVADRDQEVVHVPRRLELRQAGAGAEGKREDGQDSGD